MGITRVLFYLQAVYRLIDIVLISVAAFSAAAAGQLFLTLITCVVKPRGQGDGRCSNSKNNWSALGEQMAQIHRLSTMACFFLNTLVSTS